MPYRPSFRPPAPCSLHLAGRLATLCAVLAHPAAARAGEEATAAAPPALVVVSATRVARPDLDVPAAIDVVTAAQLAAGHARVNLTEALGPVPGLVAQDRQNFAQDLQVSVRGFGARSAFGVRGVRLITDGIPATLPDGQGQAATFNLDVAERIEILRGPFSAVYGNHAGGVIQLFSREPRGAPYLEAEASVGSDGTHKVDANVAGAGPALAYLVDASRFSTDGYRDHSAASRAQTFVKLEPVWELPGRLAIVGATLTQHGTEDPLGVTWSTWRRDPRAGEPDPSDPQGRSLAQRYDTRKSIDHAQVGARYEADSAFGHLTVAAYGGSRRVIQFQAFSRAFQAAPGHAGGVVDFARRFDGAAVRWSGTRQAGAGTLTIVAGIDLDRSRDARTGYENFIGDQLGVRGALRRDEDDLLASAEPYAQAEWATGPWHLHAGVRHTRLKVDVVDRYLANGDDGGHLTFAHTTPVLGIVRRLSTQTSVYASAAGGFETPTLNELFYSSGGGVNFALRPAASTHAELGWKLANPSGSGIDVALFAARTRDELAVDSSVGGRTSYRNAGATLREGGELAAHWCWTPALCSRTAATILRAVYRGTAENNAGKRLPGTPGASAYADLVWHHGAVEVGLEAQARGRVFADDANTATPAPGHMLLAARAAWTQTARGWLWSEFVRVNNLADRRYIGSVIVGDANRRYYEAGPGRQWLAGFRLARRFE